MRFVGSLTPTSDSSTVVTFNAAGEQVTLAQSSTWSVVFFQAHSHTAGAGAASAILTDLTGGAIYARIELTGQGSFAIENQGREISPLIRSNDGSVVLTAQVNSGSTSDQFSAGANLEQVYGDPVA